MTIAYNSLATLIGALAKVEICGHAANYGITVGDLVDQGLLNDIKISEEEGEIKGEFDNCLAPTDSVSTSQIIKISGSLGQHDLQKIAVLRNKPASDVVVTPMVADTTDGTAVLGFGTKTASKPKLYVRLTVDGVSIAPEYSTAPNDVYTSVMYEFPRSVVNIKGDQIFNKKGIWVCPFELEALWDSSVTTVGHEQYRITQTMPHTITPST